MAAAVSADEGRKPGQEPATGWTVLDRHPGRGEQCLVCGHAIHGLEVVEIRHQGRSFHVAGPMLGELMNDPDRYFSRVQARAALFDEAAVRALPIGRGWLAVGTYLVAGLVCGALCAYLAVGRARPALPWFFAGLAGNVLALAAVLAGRRGDLSALPAGVPRGLAKVPTTRAAEPCPACGNPHHPSSRRCPACGLGLTPTVRAETELV
jgi:hypothetical protein